MGYHVDLNENEKVAMKNLSEGRAVPNDLTPDMAEAYKAVQNIMTAVYATSVAEVFGDSGSMRIGKTNLPNETTGFVLRDASDASEETKLEDNDVCYTLAEITDPKFMMGQLNVDMLEAFGENNPIWDCLAMDIDWATGEFGIKVSDDLAPDMAFAFERLSGERAVDGPEKAR